MRRYLAVELLGAALREFALPALRKLADALDPAGTATEAWGPREICPDVIPEYLTSNR